MARGKPVTFYNRQIYDLERQLAAKQAQLASLRKEHLSLQAQAGHLQRQCCAIGAGVAAIRSLIEAGPDGCGGCGGAAAVLQADDALSSEDMAQADATPSWEAAIEATLFPMLASTGSADSTSLAVLGQVAAKECGIQRTLSLLSGGSPPPLQREDSVRSSTSSNGAIATSPTGSRRHGLLYTSQLLAGLLAEPGRLERLRAMPLTQRLGKLASAGVCMRVHVRVLQRTTAHPWQASGMSVAGRCLVLSIIVQPILRCRAPHLSSSPAGLPAATLRCRAAVRAVHQGSRGRPRRRTGRGGTCAGPAVRATRRAGARAVRQHAAAAAQRAEPGRLVAAGCHGEWC